VRSPHFLAGNPDERAPAGMRGRWHQSITEERAHGRGWRVAGNIEVLATDFREKFSSHAKTAQFPGHVAPELDDGRQVEVNTPQRLARSTVWTGLRDARLTINYSSNRSMDSGQVLFA